MVQNLKLEESILIQKWSLKLLLFIEKLFDIENWIWPRLKKCKKLLFKRLNAWGLSLEIPVKS